MVTQFTILSDLPSLGCTEAVTQHLGNTKTAFLSKHDQNSCLHDVLNTPTGKEAMRLLNSNRNEILIRAPVHELSNNNFLRLVEVVHGDRLEEQQASSVVLILGHHVDKADGRYVHVKTFYPTNRHINSSIIETLH
ncbi:hypothetical protein PVAND_014209 [Polypedilum vanderplanki]|uniref:Uncharacterized protein n=1 Tax=Polypedilum vanderplanki TaxID=319348 RepID=A0A9J6CTC0_POLVA|nr:hypothetical protein PVAND_014209 [Polypedilum vanderplanki]